MTEDEAKMKWCPFVRSPQAVATNVDVAMVGGCNRDDLGHRFERMNCIASACMAWRCNGSKFKDAKTGHLSDRDLTGHGAWIETGFCGLAGAPQ
jgi:hypothetical protein